MKKKKLTFLKPKRSNSLGQWLVEQGISAGFPSPADDFKAGLSNGDLIIIDRSSQAETTKLQCVF